jgi:hypothetical protein
VIYPLAFVYVDQMKTLNDHWDQIFQKTEDDKLGLFERDFSQTQKFLDKIPNWNKSTKFVPGKPEVRSCDIIFVFSEARVNI